ncbi:AsmA family protein [Methylobacterium nonmethylotrophicum]|uniref:AsmA family protein n=1 Tax=Methylobacterium nonmethylotrophicum TaxID=1141884 RepID=A0A4Z0NPS2_9HYPH|nr:AsmA-like C-terminal region-containing protein [Methylobacterium nonmethylotrophicum]TGD97999.1 AsmA family protein [Methylobacterium nonmethylotrophicum]
MSRRTILALSGGAATALALTAASLPWTIAAPQAASFAGRDLARRYGLGLAVAGPATLTLLPAPSLRFSGVRLHRGGHDLVASEGLQVQLGLAGLLAGRAEVTGLVLERARITLPEGGEADWAEPAARLAARVAAGRGRHLRRLVLVDATLTARDPRTGLLERATGVNLVASWPRPSAGLDLSAAFTWRGVPAALTLTGLRPRELAAGAATPLAAALTWKAGTAEGSAEIDGSLVWPGEADGQTNSRSGEPAGGPRLSGQGRFATPALPGTLAWLGIAPGPATPAGPVSFEGRLVARPGAVEWPEIRVQVGDNRLEGAAAASLVRGRLAVSGTLAAERLDLSGLVPGAEPGGGWSRAPLTLDGLTRGDLDLRLSAASARLGPVEAQDVAAGLLVREGTLEATLGRATVQGGTVKGRAALAALPAGLDARLQGSADRVDLGGLFADLGWPRWILGRAQGTVALDSAGSSLADLMGRLAGRAAATVEGGEILGLSLIDLAQRPETAATALRRGGRTHFERARVSLTVSDGVAEIGQGQVRGASLSASLGGRVFLAERRLGAEARIEPLSEGRAGGGFAIEGPWLRPVIRPLAVRAITSPALPAAASAYAP